MTKSKTQNLSLWFSFKNKNVLNSRKWMFIFWLQCFCFIFILFFCQRMWLVVLRLPAQISLEKVLKKLLWSGSLSRDAICTCLHVLSLLRQGHLCQSYFCSRIESLCPNVPLKKKKKIKHISLNFLVQWFVLSVIIASYCILSS